MLNIALALLASSSIAVAPAPAHADAWRIGARGECLAQLDPRFVLFVPEAPASGVNPLFRLISASPNAGPANGPTEGLRACKQYLERTAVHR
jgi:hypothetical protein